MDPPATGVSFQWFFDNSLTQAITSSSIPAADGKTYQIDPVTGVLTITGFGNNELVYNYYVTVAGPTICPGFVGQGIVQVYQNPTATFTVTNEVCFGEGGRIEIIPTGGTGTFVYSLNGGPEVSSPIFDVPTGTHSVEIRSSVGCTFLIQNIEVTGPSAPLEILNQELVNPTCTLDNGIIRFELIGGYPGYTVYYSRNGGTEQSLSVSQAGLVELAGIGVGSYQIRVVDNQGCELLYSNGLSVQEVPTEITAQDQVICEGEVATLTPSVPANITDEVFTWYFDQNGTQAIQNSTSAGVSYQINGSGELEIQGLPASGSPYTYYVMVVGTGICGVNPTPVQVTVNSIAELRVSNPSVVCDPNGTVDLTDYIEGFNPNVYDYSILSPSGVAMQISELGQVNLSGDYRVSSSLKNTGCWNNPQRIRVLIADELLVANFDYLIDLGDGNLVANDTVQLFEQIQFEDLTVGKAILWNWDFGDGNTSSSANPTHAYDQKGTYTVQLQVIDEFGCVSTYTQVIQVSDDYWVKVPNAFTPSREDGKNNFFKPYYRGIGSMEFYIFSTWGELIFQTSSLESPGWDGNLKGAPAPNGNYVYRGKFVSRSGEVVEKSGVFVLIR